MILVEVVANKRQKTMLDWVKISHQRRVFLHCCYDNRKVFEDVGQERANGTGADIWKDAEERARKDERDRAESQELGTREQPQ